jgi:hypothetical protein
VSREGVPVRLGHQAENSIAPALFALVERGAARSPAAAQQLRGRVELRFDEGYPPVSVAHDPHGCLVVEDVNDESPRPELVVTGPLPKVLELATVPRAAGLPSFRDRRGRAALATIARGGVRLEGSKLLGRRLLALIEL